MTVHPSTRPLAAGLAALALALGLGLGGCSSGGEGAEPAATGNDTTSTQPRSAPSSGAPSDDASTDSGDSGKPSKEEVAAGLYEFVAGKAPGASPASNEVVEKLTTCAVDKIYDSASAKSLQAIADGTLADADADDLTDLSNAISACTTEVTGG